MPGAAQGFEAMDARVRPRGGLFPAARPVGLRETRRDSAQEGAMAGARRMRGSTRRLGAQRVFFTGVQRGWAARKHGAARRPCGRGAPFFFFFFFFPLFFIFSKTLRGGRRGRRGNGRELGSGRVGDDMVAVGDTGRVMTSTEIASGLLPAACQVGFPAWLETLRDLAQGAQWAVRAVFLSRSRIRVGRWPYYYGRRVRARDRARPWVRS